MLHDANAKRNRKFPISVPFRPADPAALWGAGSAGPGEAHSSAQENANQPECRMKTRGYFRRIASGVSGCTSGEALANSGRAIAV